MNKIQKQILLFRARNDIWEFQFSLKDIAIKATDRYHSNCIIANKGFTLEEPNLVEISDDMIEEIERLQKILNVIKDSLEGV